MTDVQPPVVETGARVNLEVLGCGACLALSFSAASFLVDGAQSGINFSVLGGWSAFAVAAGLLLDRSPGSGDGRLLACLSLVPLAVVAWSAVRSGGLPEPARLTESLAEVAGFQAVLVGIALPWAFCRPPRSVRLLASAGFASTGAVLVAVNGSATPALAAASWGLLVAGTVAFWAELLLRAADADRTTRRRHIWLVCVLATTAAGVGGAWRFAGAEGAAYVTLSALLVLAVAVTRLRLATTFRPVAEPALDVAAGLGALVLAALIGSMVRVGGGWADLPSPWTPAAFGALLTLAAAVPAALWLRRSAMARRYGTGVITPADVALITADLRVTTDPRDLLDKAARMVAAASATDDVHVVLGPEVPEVPRHAVVHDLVVGGDQVGALVVVPADTEGLEPRQAQVVGQLVPTVALVARAVALAVETEHARRDLSRERELERRRILTDLHDVLGPVLAGMSMRVQGTARAQEDPEIVRFLAELGSDLATSRADLRRIVSGLTPATFERGGLEGALERLLASFNGAKAGPQVTLHLELGRPLAQEVEVAVYRVVAEGVTNAVRHASARDVVVSLRACAGTLTAEISDDGTGGPVHPGVGLTSLTNRAAALGGTLDVGTAPGGGVTLRLDLPIGTEVP